MKTVTINYKRVPNDSKFGIYAGMILYRRNGDNESLGHWGTFAQMYQYEVDINKGVYCSFKEDFGPMTQNEMFYVMDCLGGAVFIDELINMVIYGQEKYCRDAVQQAKEFIENFGRETAIKYYNRLRPDYMVGDEIVKYL